MLKPKTERNSSDVQQMKDGIPDRQKAETRREQFSVPQSSDGRRTKYRETKTVPTFHGKAKWRERLMTPVWIRNSAAEKKGKETQCSIFFTVMKCTKLDIVEKLLDAIKEKVTSFDISTATKKSFRLFEMSELCTTIRSGPPMDFAIFVVHAKRSRLSINEENAGIGYARFYKALQQATGA
ncbi:hypothetical protein OS493_031754 [Desmophyllum pertusum]|uniref:Uncharacterized protein n=1 Tax=Desmophyllum pertusum TaxID=174260 RepID=A0A9W9Z7Z3_9CNID|nr:hypothetical protein OS493_031754 [Desmophyllum pertusum]